MAHKSCERRGVFSYRGAINGVFSDSPSACVEESLVLLHVLLKIATNRSRGQGPMEGSMFYPGLKVWAQQSPRSQRWERVEEDREAL